MYQEVGADEQFDSNRPEQVVVACLGGKSCYCPLFPSRREPGPRARPLSDPMPRAACFLASDQPFALPSFDSLASPVIASSIGW